MKGSRAGATVTRERFSDEDALNVLRQIELELAADGTVESACRTAGSSEAMEKENARLKSIIADLELDKLILKESLDYLKPKA